MGEFVTLEVDQATNVGVLRIDRPKVNALSQQVWQEIADAADAIALNRDVRAVVVWGGPNVFAAGADIKEFPTYTPDNLHTNGEVLQRSMDRLARVPVPTIAAVNGYALGGGCEVALACDFRFAATDAVFGQPEILLGIIPGAGGTQRLPRLVGVSKAKDLVFSGRMVKADEALAIGLVDKVVEPDKVFDVAKEQAAVYAKGPRATAYAKRAIEDGIEMPLDQALRLERAMFAASFGTDDAAIGIQSFIEQGPGKAAFTGR